MIPSLTQYVNSGSTPPPKLFKPTCEPTGGQSSSNRECKSATSGMDGLRGSLHEEGISREAAELISHALGEGTRTNYETAWKKWNKWCSERNIDPFLCPLKFILDFLSDLFNKDKLAYRTIGVARSAISAYHAPIDGIIVGKHPRVSSIMKGISNLRPPQPKYCMIWDVDNVLQYLRTLPENLKLTPKQLTLKVAMLLALIAITRGSELNQFDTKFMPHSAEKYVFSFGGTVKHSKEGSFPEEPNLCPVLAES